MTYDYRVTEVVRVVDGDTVDLRVDLGFHMSALLRFRLYGVDTPERGAVGWAEATAFTKDWFTAAFATTLPIRARTFKSDSFGRWLAEVYIDEQDKETLLNTALIGSGNAVPYLR